MKNYDESAVIRSLAKKGCKIDYATSSIEIPRNTLGINSWGKVDYLVHFCKWTYVLVNRVSSSNSTKSAKKNAKEEKKEKKQFKLTNKKNKHGATKTKA